MAALLIVALHYAGVCVALHCVCCDMDSLSEIAHRHGIIVVEDAAQAMFARYKGRRCGTIGTFACISFHETKNLHCGEGGALIVNDPRFVNRAEMILEKGTNRTRSHRGEIDKYTWQDIGSSYVLSELNAAFLLAQLEYGEAITVDRLSNWHTYRKLFLPLSEMGHVEIPSPPEGHEHNGHIFWVKTRDAEERAALMAFLRERSIHSVFHYQPLHAAPAGLRYGRLQGEDRHTTRDADRLLRLPLFLPLRPSGTRCRYDW